MMSDEEFREDDEVGPLREALRVSPGNGPLRKHPVRTLARLGRWPEAETELRILLRASPRDAAIHLQLARAFEAQGRHTEASVLLEARAESGAATAAELLLLARVLKALGEPDRAARYYRRAVEEDPGTADAALATDLGVSRRVSVPAAAPAETAEDDDAAADDAVEIERPRITFADVGGMRSVKEEIRAKIVHPLQHPEIYRAYGRSAGGGVLMYGPPGCGKTYLARATAGEVRAAFIAVGIADILDRWLGQSERHLHETFERARRSAPCILFFDEVDALGASRAELHASGARHLVNQFLEEMDGVHTSNDGVLVLAATNAPWHVDPAFRRPGRFDRIIFVAPPDERARADILTALLRGKPQRAVDAAAIASRTKEFSGADLKGIVDRAVEERLRDAIRTGTPAPITTADLERALRSARPSTLEWLATARNYALHANQGGAYDDILKYLKSG